MDGLIVKSPFSKLIVSGKKDWEIRKSKTAKVGERIYILESKTHLVVGEVTISDCINITDPLFYRKNYIHHRYDNPAFPAFLPYKDTYAWILSEPVMYEEPKKYIPKPGCQTWVKNVEERIIA